MKKQPFKDDMDRPWHLNPGGENDEDLLESGLDHSDDEDDRHYGSDPGSSDYLFENEW